VCNRQTEWCGPGDNAMVWTGRDIVLPFSGLAYDTDADTWRTIAAIPQQLTRFSAVWTGDEVIAFGGTNVAETFAQGEGAAYAYDPTSDRWRKTAPTGLDAQAADLAWDGQRVIGVNYDMQAAAYDPKRDRWSALPQMPLRFYECSPNAVSYGAVVVVQLCSGYVALDDERWVPIANPRGAYGDIASAVVLAERDLYTLGDESYVYNIPIDDGHVLPGEMIPVGINRFAVTDGIEWRSSTFEHLAPGFQDQITVNITRSGEECTATSTYTGTVLGAQRFENAPGAERIRVGSLNDPDATVWQVPAGSLDEDVHLAFADGDSDVVDIVCPRVETAREVASHFERVRRGS
jgi:hypothetical protein